MTKDANVVITEMTQEPTLDEYLRTALPNQPEDWYDSLIPVLRRERAIFNIKVKERADKKEGITHDDDSE